MFQVTKYMDMDSSLIEYLGKVSYIIWTVFKLDYQPTSGDTSQK